MARLYCPGVRRFDGKTPDGGAKLPQESPVPPNLPKAYVLAFRSWMDDVLVRMKLTDTIIILSTQQCDEDSYASIDCDYNYRYAIVQLCNDFHQVPLEQQRMTIVHEYLHIHMKNLLAPWETLEEVLSQDAWTITSTSGTKAEENTISLLERVIAPSMPLPPDVEAFQDKPTKKKNALKS